MEKLKNKESNYMEQKMYYNAIKPMNHFRIHNLYLCTCICICLGSVLSTQIWTLASSSARICRQSSPLTSNWSTSPSRWTDVRIFSSWRRCSGDVDALECGVNVRRLSNNVCTWRIMGVAKTVNKTDSLWFGLWLNFYHWS